MRCVMQYGSISDANLSDGREVTKQGSEISIQALGLKGWAWGGVE